MIESTLCQAGENLTKLVVDAVKEGTALVKSGGVWFAIPVLLTLAGSVLLCCRRMARKNHLFFVTTMTAAVIVNLGIWLLGILSSRFYQHGWGVFTGEAWRWRAGMKYGLASTVFWTWLGTGVGIFVCILPAFAVACYYKLRSKKLRNAIRLPCPQKSASPGSIQS